MRWILLGTLGCLLAADADPLVKMAPFGNAPEVKIKVLKEERAVKKGESFSVRLESNPTTGYRWSVLGPDYGPLELKKWSFEKGGANPGATGVQVFEFTAKAGGQQVVLVFNYGRPFEGIGTSTYELRVQVAE